MCVGPFLWKAYGTIFTLIVKYFLCTDCTNVVCVSELVHILIWHPPLWSKYKTILNFCNEWQMTISNNGISSNFLEWTKEQVNIDSYNNVAFFQNEWATGLSCSHIFGVKKALRSAAEGRCTWNHSWTCTHMKCIFAPPWKRDPWKGSYFRGHDEGADDLCLFREKTMPEIAFDHSDFSCNVNKVN